MTSTLALNDNISSYLEIEFRKTLESILCGLNLKDLYYHRTKFKEKILACLNFSTLRDFPTDNYVKGRLIELTGPQDFTFSRGESIMPDREFFNNLFPGKHFDLYEFAKDTSKIREELGYNPGRRMLTSLLMMKPEYETKYSYIFYYLSLNPSYENGKEKEETEKLLVPNREKLDRIIQLFNGEIPSSEIIETFFSREGLNVKNLGKEELTYILNSLAQIHYSGDMKKFSHIFFGLLDFWYNVKGIDGLIADLSLFPNKKDILNFFIGNLISNNPSQLGSILKSFDSLVQEVSTDVIAGIVQDQFFIKTDKESYTSNERIYIQDLISLMEEYSNNTEIIDFLLSLGLVFKFPINDKRLQAKRFDVSSSNNTKKRSFIVNGRGNINFNTLIKRLGKDNANTFVYVQISSYNKDEDGTNGRVDIISPNGLINLSNIPQKVSNPNQILGYLTNEVLDVCLGSVIGWEYDNAVLKPSPGNSQKLTQISRGFMRKTIMESPIDIFKTTSIYGSISQFYSLGKRIHGLEGETDLEGTINDLRKDIGCLVDILLARRISKGYFSAIADSYYSPNETGGRSRVENHFIYRATGGKVTRGIAEIRQKYGNRNLQKALELSNLSVSVLENANISRLGDASETTGTETPANEQGSYEVYDKFSLLKSLVSDAIGEGEDGIGMSQEVIHIKGHGIEYVVVHVKDHEKSPGYTIILSNNYGAATYVYRGDLRDNIQKLYRYKKLIDLTTLGKYSFNDEEIKYKKVIFPSTKDEDIDSWKKRILDTIDIGPTLEAVIVELWQVGILTEEIIHNSFESFVKEWNVFIDYYLKNKVFPIGQKMWSNFLEEKHGLKYYKLSVGKKKLDLNNLISILGGFKYFFRLNPGKNLTQKYVLALIDYTSKGEIVDGAKLAKVQEEAINGYNVGKDYQIFYQNLGSIINLGKEFLSDIYERGKSVQYISERINERLELDLEGKNVPCFAKLIIDIGGTMDDHHYSPAQELKEIGTYITYLYKDTINVEGGYKEFYKKRLLGL